MNNWKELDIRIQMETLITEREGMLAENAWRKQTGGSVAYVMDNFQMLNNQFTKLLEELRRGG